MTYKSDLMDDLAGVYKYANKNGRANTLVFIALMLLKRHKLMGLPVMDDDGINFDARLDHINALMHGFEIGTLRVARGDMVEHPREFE